MTIDPTIYRGVITEAEVVAMNERTEQRRQEAIKRLGAAWLGYVRPKHAAAPNVSPIQRSRKAAK